MENIIDIVNRHEVITMKNNLKYYRKQTGLTQGQLAEKANVSRQTINKIEKKENVNINLKTMQQIADALGNQVKDIFFE